MYAVIETRDNIGHPSLELVMVRDRSHEVALDLWMDNAGEEEIDAFLDNCDEHYAVTELLGAVVRGEVEPHDRTYFYCGDEVIVSLGKTREQASWAYVNGRIAIGC